MTHPQLFCLRLPDYILLSQYEGTENSKLAPEGQSEYPYNLLQLR